MKKLLLALTLLFASPCLAQQVTPVGPLAPCSAFGTTSGTCAQGGVVTAGGPTGSATVAPVITYNAAGQLTAVTTATIAPAIGSVTGLGTGVATALSATASGPTSWTPTDASGSALTFTSVSAYYTQSNHTVCVAATLTYPSVSVDVNAAKIGGFPVNFYTSAPNQTMSGFGTQASGDVLIGLSNTATMTISTGALGTVTNAQMSLATVRISGCYITA